jgi:hypothetical protein
VITATKTPLPPRERLGEGDIIPHWCPILRSLRRVGDGKDFRERHAVCPSPTLAVYSKNGALAQTSGMVGGAHPAR